MNRDTETANKTEFDADQEQKGCVGGVFEAKIFVVSLGVFNFGVSLLCYSKSIISTYVSRIHSPTTYTIEFRD